jgi:hypothetical protein
MAQAVTASPAEGDKEDKWDDYEYELGAVALPLLGGTTEGLGLAAVATWAEMKKARTRKKLQLGAALGPRSGAAAGLMSRAVGTAILAPPVDAVAVDMLTQ